MKLRKTFKIVILIVLILLVLCCLFFISSRIRLKRDRAFLTENGYETWNMLAANDVPKLYICAEFGYTTKEELIADGGLDRETYLRFFHLDPDTITEWGPLIAHVSQSETVQFAFGKREAPIQF